MFTSAGCTEKHGSGKRDGGHSSRRSNLYSGQGRSQDFENGEAKVTQGGAEGPYI